MRLKTKKGTPVTPKSAASVMSASTLSVYRLPASISFTSVAWSPDATAVAASTVLASAKAPYYPTTKFGSLGGGGYI